ncbi:MAG TPA: hypothetical protein VLH15_05750 [Dehalococcoidales bacterium]|nr:hypothetical protein [Dehalococcoidales bacterium]
MIGERIEESIFQLAKEYQGNGAFFFHNEADLKCRLFGLIRSNIGDKQLVHSEWGEDKPYGRYDLVVWRPSEKDAAFNCWGCSHSELMEKVPDLILAAIEIDCLYGGCAKANQFTTDSGLGNNKDIQKLIQNNKDSFPYCYLILFWDDEASEKFPEVVAEISEKCEQLLLKHKIRSICISREKDNILFKLGYLN